MCRQAVAAAAAAFGKPGGLSGQARSPPFDPARGGQGGHLPVAPSPFDSQLVHSSLQPEPPTPHPNPTLNPTLNPTPTPNP